MRPDNSITFSRRRPLSEHQPQTLQHGEHPPHKQAKLDEIKTIPETVRKCANFFRTLIFLADNRLKNVETKAKVYKLVRECLLTPMESQGFISELEVLMDSQSQPKLLPFLNENLATLRTALIDGDLALKGLIEEDDHQGTKIPSVPSEEFWQCDRNLADKHLYSLRNQLFTDVVFVVGDEQEKIPAHKYMLMVTSPVFEKLFSDEITNGVRSETIEHNGKTVPAIKISDVCPEAMNTFLEYLYSEKEPEELKGSCTKRKIELALNLIYIAKKYLVKKLEDLCVTYLTSKINFLAILDIYEHAILFDIHELLESCKSIFKKSGIESLFRSKLFKDISLPTLSAILELDELGIDEFNLYGCVLTWARAECERQTIPITPKNLRQVLGKAFYSIRFPAMKPEEFADIAVDDSKFFVDPGRLLTDAECVRIFSYLVKPDESRQDLQFKAKPRNS